MIGNMSSGIVSARIFMSYVHADQDGAYTGDLRQFADDVIDALEGLHQVTAKLFTDVNDGDWGEILWERIDQELERSTFFLPFITPRYLASDSCRREFNRFVDAAERRGDTGLVLPLLWINHPALHSDDSGDDIIEKLQRIRYIDCTSVATSDRSSSQYRNKVTEAAQALEATITRLENYATGTVPPTDDDSVEAPKEGLDEVMVRVEEAMPEVVTSLEEFMASFDSFSQEFSDVTQHLGTGGSPRQVRAAMLTAGHRLRGSSADLQTRSSEAASAWDSLVSDLNTVSRISRELDAPIEQEVVQELKDLDKSMSEAAPQISDMAQVVRQMPMLSSSLTAPAKALERSMRTLRSMHASLREWLSEIDYSSPR